jgi:hypothetical protein
MPDHWEREAAARDMIPETPRWWTCECKWIIDEGQEKPAPKDLWTCDDCKATFDYAEVPVRRPFDTCPKCGSAEIAEVVALCPDCGKPLGVLHDPAYEDHPGRIGR